MSQIDLKEYLNKISNNMVELLEIHSMSILELSNKTGISYSSLHNLVNKKQNPTLETLLGICVVLGIKLSQLCGDIPLFRSHYSSQVKEVPTLGWEEVLDHSDNKITILHKNNIIISCSNEISDNCFALKAYKLTFFTDNSILIFDKVNMELIKYNNRLILVSTDGGVPAIKKLVVDGNKLFLESVTQNLPIRELLSTDRVLSYLFQVRIDF